MGSQEGRRRVLTGSHALCHKLGESARLYPGPVGVCSSSIGDEDRSALHNEIAEDLLVLARRGGDHALLLQAHHAAWATAFSRGDLKAAMVHTKEGVLPLRQSASTPQWPRRLATTTRGYVAALFRARALALLGRTAEATQTSSDAIVLARELAHPFSQGVGAGVLAAAVDQVLRDARGGKSTRSSGGGDRAASKTSGLCWHGRQPLKGGPEAEQGTARRRSAPNCG